MTSKGNTKWLKREEQNRLEESICKDEIRALDMRMALEFYGMQFDSSNSAPCPFHKETNGSFRVKSHYWHCFGCGETGDLIKFVRKMFGMSYPDALNAICADFGISRRKATDADRDRANRLKVERAATIQKYQALLKQRDLCLDAYLLAWDVLNYAAQYGGKRTDNDRFVSAQYVLLRSRMTLEAAEYDCAQFLRENPVATPIPPQNASKTRCDVTLPPAPKWNGCDTHKTPQKLRDTALKGGASIYDRP